ncbi:MAG: hypothetical protein ABSA81_04315 [Candidatus Bathyarchaeia archaeon]
MIVEVGNYTFPESVGYKGWVVLSKVTIFERLDGRLSIVSRYDTTGVLY